MELFYLINYSILAAFLSLFTVELGVALTALFWWNKYNKKIKRYINPIWAVNGTFLVFYVVNLVATYPTLIPDAGLIYVAPALFGALLLLFRNGFIAYSEVANKPNKDRKYTIVYAFATLLIGFIAISILASGVSGDGVSLFPPGLNLFTMFVNPFSLILFLAVFLMALFMATVFFNIKELKKFLCLILLASVLLIIFDINLYVPYMFSNALANEYLLLLDLAVFSAGIIAFYKNKSYAKEIVFIGLFLGIIVFGTLQFPYVFGGITSFTNFLNNSAITPYILLITIIGGVFLVSAMAAFIYINYFKKDENSR